MFRSWCSKERVGSTPSARTPTQATGEPPRPAARAFMLAAMEVATARPGYELWRPNREKAETKTMKAIIAFVLLVSAALLIIITIGGWERLLGPRVAGMSTGSAARYIL